MNGWMIAVDGSAVNLAQVTHVTGERRSTGSAWYVMAYFSGNGAIALTADLDSREAVVAWIEQRFRSFDRHVSDATKLIATSS